MPPADFAFSVQPVSTRTSAALLPVRYALLEPTPTVQRASSHAATAPLALGLLPAVILVARAYAWLDSLVRMVGHALLAEQERINQLLDLYLVLFAGLEHFVILQEQPRSSNA